MWSTHQAINQFLGSVPLDRMLAVCLWSFGQPKWLLPLERAAWDIWAPALPGRQAELSLLVVKKVGLSEHGVYPPKMTILMGRMNIIHWKSLEIGVPYFHISPERVIPTAQSSRISYQPIGTTRVTAWMFWTLLISYRVPNILGDGSNQTLYTGQIDLSCFGLSNHPISSSGTQFWPRPHLSRLIKYLVQSWCSPQVWCARAWGLAAVGSKQRAEKWSCLQGGITGRCSICCRSCFKWSLQMKKLYRTFRLMWHAKVWGWFWCPENHCLGCCSSSFPQALNRSNSGRQGMGASSSGFFSQNHAFRLGPEVATVAPNGPMLLGDLGARCFKGWGMWIVYGIWIGMVKLHKHTWRHLHF